ncbi:hypothetical protein ARMSODRAFT_970858 [Armillaria solidipes]|uniref:Uncharacterized protein n=1 Tax=Armillaria solidipes TaxID=1076256 RepID=A0A2H3BVH6_9AGAR|nr:hypothetical protein ARMSODRAFT_970858 [Armillaria solidipes]
MSPLAIEDEGSMKHVPDGKTDLDCPAGAVLLNELSKVLISRAESVIKTNHITHIPVPLASTAGIGGIPTPAHDIPVGLQLPSSNPAPATHPTFLSDTGVAQPPVAAPHSAVPRTPLMDATSKDQMSSPRPRANQYNDDASPLSGIIAFVRKFMGWMSTIASSLLYVTKVFNYCEDNGDDLS